MLETESRSVPFFQIFASDSFLELTEFTREEILGRNCRYELNIALYIALTYFWSSFYYGLVKVGISDIKTYGVLIHLFSLIEEGRYLDLEHKAQNYSYNNCRNQKNKISIASLIYIET